MGLYYSVGADFFGTEIGHGVMRGVFWFFYAGGILVRLMVYGKWLMVGDL